MPETVSELADRLMSEMPTPDLLTFWRALGAYARQQERGRWWQRYQGPRNGSSAAWWWRAAIAGVLRSRGVTPR